MEAARNAKEQADYEQKKAGIGVKCTFHGCGFVAKNEKGLKSHWGQKHAGVEDTSGEESDDGAESSVAATTTTAATMKKEPSKYVCPNVKCGQDCSSGAGLARHLRCKPDCHAAADELKKEQETAARPHGGKANRERQSDEDEELTDEGRTGQAARKSTRVKRKGR